ncbi:hypothetical protein BDV10DRAFT_190465 [Aspergillus recurvatus]
MAQFADRYVGITGFGPKRKPNLMNPALPISIYQSAGAYSNALQGLNEVEFSLFETGILTNGVAPICAGLHIPIIAYSPLGCGILTGDILKASGQPLGSALRRTDRFQGNNLDENLRLVQELHRLSLQFIPYTMPNIALSWLRTQSQRKKELPEILPYPWPERATWVALTAFSRPTFGPRTKRTTKKIALEEAVATHVNNATNALPPVNGTAELPQIDDSNLPHGGAKKSGFGRFSALAGLDEWLRYKVVTFDS